MQERIHGKNITIFGNLDAERLVLYTAFGEEGENIWQFCLELGCPDFCLVVIGGIEWEKDLSPWPAERLFADSANFSGGADAYLKELEESIVPYLEKKRESKIQRLYLAGYSLAGLFALYSGYHWHSLDGIVCASGSLWYPNFLEYAGKKQLQGKIKAVYFSLGNREAKTKHPLMCQVAEYTQYMYALLEKQGVKTRFEWNKGGHFKACSQRVAKGICWILQEEK